MKICVADDEQEVRLSIIHKLQSIYPHADIYDVSFGTLAFEQILLVRPDLAILDIRMPQMDGLQILQALKQSGITTKVVMLSGYDEFEYARKALQLGAIDYLLKPADREELQVVVNKVSAQMEQEFLQEFEFIFSKQSSQLLFIDHIHCYDLSGWFDERILKQLWIGYEAEWELLQTQGIADKVLFRFTIDSDYVGIVSQAEVKDTHTNAIFHEKQDFISVLNKVVDEFEFTRFFQGDVLPIQIFNKAQMLNRVLALRKSIIAVTIDLNKASYAHLESLVNEWLGCLPLIRISQLKKECVNMMAMLDEGLMNKDDLIILDEEKLHYWLQWINKHRTWNELRERIRKFILDGFMALVTLNEKRQQEPHNHEQSWLEQVGRFLDASTDLNVGLEAVAKYANVHPVTLSRLFKQETGTTFVRYLTQRRLMKAKELLLHSDKKIQAISEEVGYMDYRYFRNRFKHEYGLNPKEYRHNNGVDLDSDE